LFVDAGLLVLCSFISPFEAERRMVRERVAEGEFIEIFVDTPLEECMRRDPKGLYAKARRGEIKNFTGIDSPYEVPDNAELHLQTAGLTPEALADKVVSTLHERGIIA
jgi:bifunctional enzyme CysN/CysC